MVLFNRIIDFIAMPFVYVIGLTAFFLIALGWGIKTVICCIANTVWESLFVFEEKMFNCKFKKQYGKFLDFISSFE